MFIQNRVAAYHTMHQWIIIPNPLRLLLKTVANAWDRVSQQVIVNCWQKTRILFSTNDEIEETERAFEEEWVNNCVSMERLFN